MISLELEVNYKNAPVKIEAKELPLNRVSCLAISDRFIFKERVFKLGREYEYLEKMDVYNCLIRYFNGLKEYEVNNGNDNVIKSDN